MNPTGINPSEEATRALGKWETLVGAGVPALYLSRVRLDAAVAAWGEYAGHFRTAGGAGPVVFDMLGRADDPFRDGVQTYLTHVEARTEDTKEFFAEIATKLDGIVTGRVGDPAGFAGGIKGADFWSRLESRIDGVRAVFTKQGVYENESSGAIAASFVGSIVTAGELSARGLVSSEAVLPVRALSAGDLRPLPPAAHTAKVYQGAYAEVGRYLEQEAKILSVIKSSTTARAIVPVLVASGSMMSVSEIAETAGVARNTAATFLERIQAMGLVKCAEAELRTYQIRSIAIAGDGADAARLLLRRRGVGQAPDLPDEASADRGKGRGR